MAAVSVHGKRGGKVRMGSPRRRARCPSGLYPVAYMAVLALMTDGRPRTVTDVWHGLGGADRAPGEHLLRRLLDAAVVNGALVAVHRGGFPVVWECRA